MSPRRTRSCPALVGRDPVLSLVLAAVLLPSLALAQTRTWVQPASGYWSAPANWADGQVPDSPTEAALIPSAMGACVVLLDANRTLDAVTIESPQALLYLGGYGLWLSGIGGLTNHGTLISNTGASTLQGAIHNQAGGSLRVRGGSTLSLPGPGITNDGTVLVNDQSQAAVAGLEFPVSATLQGGGDVWLTALSPWAQVNTAPGAVLTNAAGHTIHGTGEVNARLVNQGTVSGDWPSLALVLKGSEKTNTGVMKAAGGGGLAIDGVRVENAGGEIQAEGGNVILGAGAAIHGGVLGTQGPYAFLTAGDCRLEDVTSQGAVKIHAGNTLTVAGPGLTNNGQCTVNYESVAVTTSLTFEGAVALVGGGSVQLAATSPWAQVNTAPGAVLTNAAGHTIHGAGEVNARLVNQGTVSGDWPNQGLVLKGSEKTNLGMMKAAGGGWLAIDGAQIDNRLGQIKAEGGNVTLGGGAVIAGGALGTSDPWAIYTSGDATLGNVTNLGALRIGEGHTLTVTGPTLTNQGTITVNRNSVAVLSSLTFQGEVTLQGNGDVWLAAAIPWARLATTSGSTLTNATGHLIHGTGEISAHLVNHGTVSADWAGQGIGVSDPGFLNLGVVEARNNATLTVANPAGNYAGGTLSGGIWRVMANCVLRLLGATIQRNAAAIVLDGANSYLVRDIGVGDALANLVSNLADGFLTIRNGRGFATANPFANAGELTVGKGSVFQAGAAGDGYTQSATGKLRFEIGGRSLGDYGRLAVTGKATLAGVLAAELADGFVPALGDTFQVATYGSMAGGFHHFEAPVVNGLRLVPTIYAKRIVLTALPPGVDVAEPIAAAPERVSLAARLVPAAGVELELALPAAGDVRLELFDLHGRRVAELWRGPRPAGVARFPVTGAGIGLVRGMYFARAEVGSGLGREVRTARVVWLK